MKARKYLWMSLCACASTAVYAQQPVIGLITKTETNPFFVKMKEGAQPKAKAKGAKLLTAAGKFDGDNASQVTAIENMVDRRRQGDPDHAQRHQGDRPGDQEGARRGRAGDRAGHADRSAGSDRRAVRDRQLQGRRADRPVCEGGDGRQAGRRSRRWTWRRASRSGKLRHDGFLQGFGIKEGDPSIVCSQDTQGDQAKGQTAMENCLQKAPDINVVYTINEPAAAGAYQALKAAGKEKDVLIVSVDGGCAGVKNVQAGIIAATSQQYPLKMASMGVEAGVDVRQDRQEGLRATPTPASP